MIRRFNVNHQIVMLRLVRLLVKKQNYKTICFIFSIILLSLVLLHNLEVKLLKSRKAFSLIENHEEATTVPSTSSTSTASIERNKSDEDDMFADVKRRMRDRRQHMKAACHRLGLDKRGHDSLHNINPWEYFINHKHNLVWCSVFKSASTSWMYIMNVLAGYSPDYLDSAHKVPLNMARAKYPRPKPDKLREVLRRENVTSMIIGRHPLERLVSAYREKIVGARPGTLHDKLRRRITRDFRHVTIPRVKRLPEHLIPTFTEFVQFLIRENEKEKTPEMHWAPVYSFCNPCQVNLNTILKLETLEEDTQYVLNRINAPEILTNVEQKNKSKGGSSHDAARKYLNELDQELFEELVNIYKNDFLIFGYDIPKYSENKNQLN